MNKKLFAPHKKLKLPVIIWSVVSLILVIVLVAGNIITSDYESIISTYFNQPTTMLVQDENDNADTTYYSSSFSSESEMREAGEELCEDIVAEGAVLLKNADMDGVTALPLADSERNIHFFSISSYDFVYGGTGSGSVDSGSALKLNEIFSQSDYGFTYNQTLWNFYADNPGAFRRGQMTTFDDRVTGTWMIKDANPSNFSQAVKDSLSSVSSVNDIVITVIARQGSEGGDLPSGTESDRMVDEGNEHFLELTTTEKALLEYVGTLDVAKNIVVINSANPLELGWINNEEYGIDAVLWIPSTGQTGLKALPKILAGDINPSGSLMDTWAYNALSSPAAQNMGDHSFGNATDYNLGSTYDKYVVYQEGIYVGYKYYETRYYDSMTNQGNANGKAGSSVAGMGWDYDNEVMFPFGYGMSYTEFDLDGFTMEKDGEGNYILSINVTNVGDVAGKSAVQFYLSAPYEPESGVERAAVELVDFNKTGILEPGASETLSVTVSRDNLKSYDYQEAETYIIQGGDYYFTAAFDAHEAANNILAAKEGKTDLGNALLAAKDFVEADKTAYSVSAQTGEAVGNKMEMANLNNYEGYEITYLSRSDWQGTFPTEQFIDISREIVDAQKMMTAEDLVADGAEMPTTDGEASINAVAMIGKDYEDELWDDLLDKMTFDEMSELIRMGGYKTAATTSITLNVIGEQDGPAGISATLIGGGTKCMAYPSEITLAATLNKDLVKRFAEMVGEDALYATDDTTKRQIAGWYAPSVNIHRTPFSGRNFEYFSEDAVLNGLLASEVIDGASEKGLVCFLKHFAFNDQETNRIGINTFGNEQAFREIYLRPFEIAVVNSPCTAIMSSMNRVGPVWAGSCRELITDILRNEWGYKGRVLSDYNGANVYATYQSVWGALYAGNDQMLNTNKSLYSLDDCRKNAAAVILMRNACHNILYSVINGAGMNGHSASTMIVKVTPLWQKLLIAGTCIIRVAIVISGGFVIYGYRKNKKKFLGKQETPTQQ